MTETIVKSYLLLPGKTIWETDYNVEPSLELQALDLLGIISIQPSNLTYPHIWIKNLTDKKVILTFRRKEKP